MRSLWVVLVVMLAVENGCNGCLEKERIALLQLKDSINFPNGASLPSWEEDNNMDCCHWELVECNSTTRRVIKLELYGARDWEIDDYWHLNASILLPFESLRSLNLSSNQLRSFVGNEGIGILAELSNLEELDLSWNRLENSIIPSLNKLSNLKILNLARNELNGSISAKGTGILSNLTNLEELDLSQNNLGNGILSSLNKLSNLKFLRLAWNNLNGSIYVKEFDGLNNLKELDLSNNAIASISALNVVIMLAAENGCNGSLEKERIALLQLKDSINFPNGNSLPSWEEDDHLDCCQWEGMDCNSTTRRVIKLSLNDTRDWGLDGHWHLNGSILLPLELLRSLDLSQNQLHNSVRIEGLGILSNLSNLESIDLRYNGLDNSILPSLNKLSNLKILNLAGNALNESIFIKEFDGLSNLKELDLSKNAIANIRALNSSQEESGRLNKLEVLYLSSNFLDDTIWSCLRELSSIKTLDLSGNHGLHGAVPNEFVASGCRIGSLSSTDLVNSKTTNPCDKVKEQDFLRRMKTDLEIRRQINKVLEGCPHVDIFIECK